MRNLLAQIHIAKKELGMDDATYRAMLHSVAGVTSAKDLSVAAATKVIANCKRLGWKPKAATKAGRKPTPAQHKARLMAKIEAMLATAGRPWAYADAMAARMFGVDKTDWLAPEQLVKVVAALTYDAKRNGRQQG